MADGQATVTELPPLVDNGGKRPAHHADDTQTRFLNPWPSWRDWTGTIALKLFTSVLFRAPKVPPDLLTTLPRQAPTWGVGSDPAALKATWLGHACYLVEFPTPQDATRGLRVLFDPALSHRCSPFQWMGPQRLTSTACKTTEIPVIDAIVLSHNHYDHTDSSTLQTLYGMHKPHVFAALGNLPYLLSLDIPQDKIHTMDWWDARLLSVPLPPKVGSTFVAASLKVTCTPAQHTAARGTFDKWRSLWASWAVEEIVDGAGTPSPAIGKKTWFAGDTGYRTIRNGEDEDKLPVCPAFAEIGRRFDGFDFAMIPIGAYAPRELFSNMHACPRDSVDIFKDVKAKKALAMHWGTWILTSEPILEPPELLKKECTKAGLQEGDFDVCALGETRYF
ncbi:N-acyl-phosphatidylethanolamine-hydrolyzing phospholipase D [Obba rivulosa]|uniref:N-acyl-phosphatidylethanolamine-hydrolyzing phospholipase D n=1 Tax=Obba rivulosa TaxID=1052685 RepID=A0A8E2DPS4_9APHY|nr:N-acyl-phosphatidylethanolamine-hydrolyzing phospholipase D [Obba rivulosa]